VVNSTLVVHADLGIKHANEATDDKFRMIVKKFIYISEGTLHIPDQNQKYARSYDDEKSFIEICDLGTGKFYCQNNDCMILPMMT
ncbi:7864_t:CDS:2, partial [Gigaspora rosea]